MDVFNTVCGTSGNVPDWEESKFPESILSDMKKSRWKTASCNYFWDYEEDIVIYVGAMFLELFY